MKPWQIMRNRSHRPLIPLTPGITARAWRLYITKRNPPAGTTAAGYMNISMGLCEFIGGENICAAGGGVLIAGAVGTQSSQYNASLGAAGGFGEFRESVGQFWHTTNQAGPWWAAVDFGAGNSKTVRELFIVPRNTFPDQRTPYDFVLQTSPDASTWTTVLTVNAVTGWVVNEEKAWSL